MPSAYKLQRDSFQCFWNEIICQQISINIPRGSLNALFHSVSLVPQGMLNCERTTNVCTPFFTHYNFAQAVVFSRFYWPFIILILVNSTDMPACVEELVHSLGLVPPAMLFAPARSSHEGSVTIYPGASFYIRRLHVKWQQLVQLIS